MRLFSNGLYYFKQFIGGEAHFSQVTESVSMCSLCSSYKADRLTGTVFHRFNVHSLYFDDKSRQLFRQMRLIFWQL